MHNLLRMLPEMRVQRFSASIADYLIRRPAVRGASFIDTQPLNETKYLCGRNDQRRLVPVGVLMDVAEPIQYMDMFARLDRRPNLRIFPRLIPTVSLLDHAHENLPEELRQMTSTLVFRRVLPRSALRNVADTRPLPSIDELVFFGIPLDPQTPEVRRLQMRLIENEVQAVKRILAELKFLK